ncbi:DUF3160 domain-containing protein [Proteiniborus sp. MB09-C3]|uniref:DUF3160 domain-containing protein n=1 Tax=Proteiniborus sp. MB09-C3 TaxID=3050072 RepID=UPI00255772F3|nr:DUF3160 domain-containing protein [Proteiniborus sp. MB09-C3]WIV11770.1 DUF3160 domain-containing protein [Proteiniborus sp. MB09-C3]
MKRIATLLVIIIVFNSILFGCSNNSGIDIEDNPANAQKDLEDINKSNINWSIPEEIKNIQIAYKPTAYKANVKPYTIKEDLSNIENIERFSGFTDEQKKMLSENGFIVLPSRSTKLNYIYEENEYSDIPNFVTADTVLHLYHQFYGKSLIFVESELLSKELETLTDRMLNKSIALLEQIEDNELKNLQKKNVTYFLIAKMLILGDENIAVTADDDILSLAKKEYKLIQDSSGIEKSVLFENEELDYSQFTVRGHYTRSTALENYFKTMMWYGFTPINLMNLQTKELYYENTLMTLLITYTAFIDYKGSNDIKAWSNIYEPTGFYVGQSDDINIIDIRDMIISIFGEDIDVNSFNDPSFYDKIQQGVKDLREPKIVGKFVSKPTVKSFKLMGQRYILDGFIMQELMEPLKRPVPNGLDVMGVLGSDRGEDLLFKVYRPQKSWPEYEEKYKELKSDVKSYKDELWQSNLYNGWLWSIKKQLTEFDENSGMPVFMINDGWRSKSLNAALSSYAELKHDTVLYGKQPVAEAGGPMITYDQHYVEPNAELYDTLLWLMKYTVENLKARNLLNNNILEGTESHIKLLELLKSASIKELNNEPLTEDEKNSLLWVGGAIENIINCYTVGSASEDELFNGVFPIEKSAMIVSDVATLPGNHYLSMGTGYFDEIYVVIPVEDKLYLTRGAVYSYYEFTSDKRLTDEEWYELHGLKTIKADGYEYVEYGEPSKQLPSQPFWVNTFKSKTNNVKIEFPEVDWEKSNE